VKARETGGNFFGTFTVKFPARAKSKTKGIMATVLSVLHVFLFTWFCFGFFALGFFRPVTVVKSRPTPLSLFRIPFDLGKQKKQAVPPPCDHPAQPNTTVPEWDSRMFLSEHSRLVEVSVILLNVNRGEIFGIVEQAQRMQNLRRNGICDFDDSRIVTSNITKGIDWDWDRD
jgi:hypothetical protein